MTYALCCAKPSVAPLSLRSKLYFHINNYYYEHHEATRNYLGSARMR
jgi:hypothetical protein